MKKILTVFIIASILLSCGSFANAEESSANVNIGEVEGSTENTENTPSIPEGTVIWVKADFKGGDGSFEKPYSSITQAQAAVRKLSNEEKAKGVTVMLREGEYNISSTLEFTDIDSGVSSDKPVTYCGYGNEKAVIKATKTLPKHYAKKVVSSDAVYQRLNRKVADKIYVYDLSAAGIKSLGSNYYKPLGTADSNANASLGDADTIMVYSDGIEMPNSIYPNTGEKLVDDSLTENEFFVVTADSASGEKERLAKWKNVTDGVFIYYSRAGFRYFVIPMKDGKIESSSNKIYLNTNYMTANAAERPTKGARYRILNLVEEIDTAGEWAIDYTNKKLYFYPASEKLGDLELTTLNKPVISINEAQNIAFKNLTIGYVRSDAFKMSGCKNILVDGCKIINTSGTGISITGIDTKAITVKNSEVSHTGSSGIYLEGNGKKDGYVKSDVIIENNEVFDTGKIDGIIGAIEIRDTIGAKIIKNRVHNCPSIAINLQKMGNVGTVVENNEIYDAVRGGVDLGAIYCPGAANWGVSVSNNYVHDVYRYSKAAYPVSGIYLDADGTGLTVKNNIVQNVTTYGFHWNGGDCNVFENNIILNAGSATLYSSNIAGGWDSSKIDTTLTYFNGPSKEYLEIFPSLNYQLADKGKNDLSGYPRHNTIKNNVSAECGAGFSYHQHVYDSALEMDESKEYKKIEDAFDFKDVNNYDLSFTENSPAIKANPDFKVIDFNSMGLKNSVELEAPKLIAPYNGEENVDISNSVLRWHGNNHSKYRVIAARDANFVSVVLDETVVGTAYTPTTLKYGNKTFYWKVIPVRESKADIDKYVESEVYSFKTLKNEDINKTELRALLKKVGTDYDEFEGYSKEAIENMKEAYAFAKKINENDTAKQVHVRTAVKRLSSALTKLYESVSVETVKINSYIADNKNWIIPDGSVADGKEVTIVENAPSRTAIYTGKRTSAGQILKFKGTLNYSNWQMFGFQDNPDIMFWSDKGYYILFRDGSYEIQRYEYDENGTLQGGILATLLNTETISGEEMDYEIGYMEVHNGTRLIFKVNGVLAVDYVDTSDLAFSDSLYFSMCDASYKEMTIKPVE